MSAQRKIITVNNASMIHSDPLVSKMNGFTPQRVGSMMKVIDKLVDERCELESNKVRRGANGRSYTELATDNKDIVSGLLTFKHNEAFARMVLALSLNPREIIYPQSQEGGKRSTQTESIKGHRKMRQLADLIWSGNSDVESVVKVATVCMFKFAQGGVDVLKREHCEEFLSSREFNSLDQGSVDLWNSIDDVRAKHMTSGKSTQTSQCIRQLVALNAAVDVQQGKEKNVSIFKDGLVFQALMHRFGILALEGDAQA